MDKQMDNQMDKQKPELPLDRMSPDTELMLTIINISLKGFVQVHFIWFQLNASGKLVSST